MIELVRIIENQSVLSSYRATKDEDRALQLELLIEKTKPENNFLQWHPLIATPFRYSPPLLEARFRTPFGKNIFYGSLIEETALYEHAFHFIKQRRHLKIGPATGIRTIFFVNADEKNSIHIIDHPNYSAIMDKNNYSASHQFIISNPEITFIVYPSCRDPQQRNNAAVLDIKQLDKNPKWESTIKFFYDYQKQEINWLDYNLHIQWNQVS